MIDFPAHVLAVGAGGSRHAVVSVISNDGDGCIGQEGKLMGRRCVARYWKVSEEIKMF
jgi:hypothetical protein